MTLDRRTAAPTLGAASIASPRQVCQHRLGALPDARPTTMRILLAEDEPELANWLVRALQQSGFQVDWVDDGRMVRRCLKATRYDALVLDLGLPGVGGHDVLAELREADQRLPVLILTARDSLIERVNTLNEGADDFLAKPFEVAELEARLTALIRRARGSAHPRLSCGPWPTTRRASSSRSAASRSC